MGLLDIFSKADSGELSRLPEGSFTVDPEGRIITSTVPQWFPAARLQDMGQRILATFAGARKAQIPFGELIFHYGALRITARELKGGAIVFLSPKTTEPTVPKP